MPGNSTLRGVAIGLLGLLFCVAGDAFSALGAEDEKQFPFASGALGAIFGGPFLAGYAAFRFGLEVRSSRTGGAAAGVFRRERASARSARWPIGCVAVANVFYLPLLVAATQRVDSFATVIAIAFCGPLLVAVWGAMRESRYAAVLWPVLAGAGLWIMSLQEEAHTDWLGYAFAAAAAACFAVNISAMEKLEERGAETVGLALAGLLTIPGAAGWLVFSGGLEWFQPRIIALAVLTGLVTVAVAPVLEARAIGYLGKEKFGVLAAGEPIMGLPVGLLLLGEVPGWFVATGVVILAVAIAANTAELDRPLVRRLVRRLRTTRSGGLPHERHLTAEAAIRSRSADTGARRPEAPAPGTADAHCWRWRPSCGRWPSAATPKPPPCSPRCCNRWRTVSRSRHRDPHITAAGRHMPPRRPHAAPTSAGPFGRQNQATILVRSATGRCAHPLSARPNGRRGPRGGVRRGDSRCGRHAGPRHDRSRSRADARGPHARHVRR
ncbi:EamA family transporter [Actinomadura sp. KC345]|uniref:EamA family transporter n=1 Tax=Actinomadura sp. KC345 TaxID=2530371 RepID=UPI001A9D0BC4|nr:EamA family transporter [Actinomadura sp. KC345]